MVLEEQTRKVRFIFNWNDAIFYISPSIHSFLQKKKKNTKCKVLHQKARHSLKMFLIKRCLHIVPSYKPH